MGRGRKKEKPGNMSVQLDDLISSEALAKQWGITERCLRKWTHDGLRGVRLRKVKVGTRVFFEKRDAELFVEMTQPRACRNEDRHERKTSR